MARMGCVAAAALGVFLAASWASTVFVPSGALLSGLQASRDAAGFGATAGLRSLPSSVPSTFVLSVAAIVAGAAVLGVRSRFGRAVVRRATAEADTDPYAYLFRDTGFAGGLIGGQTAWGDYNFDPLNISERCYKYLPWFREAELKHGRVAMLAWVGLVVPEVVRIPGPEACYQAPSIVAAHKACVDGPGEQGGPLFQVYLFCGLIEMLTTFPKCAERGGLTLENAGDYRLGINYLPKDEAKAKEMKLKELKNGRLAMLAFGGAITQAVLTGNGFPWLYAERKAGSQGALLGASVPAASAQAAVAGASRLTLHAEQPTTGGYKMSKSVPFLPVSPALEGYAGEEDGFDPMGFSLALDIRWLREAELKHARVAMLAVVGWISTDLGMRVPGEPFQVTTVEAHDAMVKFGSMGHMLSWISFLELFGFIAITTMCEGKTDRKPGDFGIRTLYPKDEAGQYDMQMRELRNGRLAMLAFGGIATSAVLTAKTWPFFATVGEARRGTSFGKGAALCGGLQGPPARFEGSAAIATHALERSASLPFLPKPQNLAGFVGEEQEFDPLNFSETFDVKWLREAELKHGRVCMLATVGFFAQQYITFPGFTETPDALKALATAPPAATISLLLLVGYIESKTYDGKMTMLDMFEDSDRVPGDFNFGAGVLKGKSDKEVYDMKLKELSNGRLAMFAIFGMIGHNGVVQGPLFPTFPDGWVFP